MGKRIRSLAAEQNLIQLVPHTPVFDEARLDLMFVSCDDAFLEVDWLVEELIANFDRYADTSYFSQFRGLNVFPRNGRSRNGKTSTSLT